MAEKLTSYLSELRFDEKLRNTWWAKFITEFRFVFILIFLMIVMGIFGYANIPRRLNPEINIAIVTVATVLPGASPEDVEQLVTIPLEDSINSVKDIDTMTSTSTEGVSSIVIQFRSGVDGDKARTDVSSAVDSVNTLPTDATDPKVTKLDFEDEPIWTFAVTATTNKPSLMRFSKQLKERIESLSKVDRVLLSGYDEQYVEVVIDPDKVATYGFSPLQISQAVQKAANSYPAGVVESGAATLTLTIDRKITTLEDIRNLRFVVSGKYVRLGDIATVAFTSRTEQGRAVIASRTTVPTDAVQFMVYKSKSSNIDAAQKDVQAMVDKTFAQYNGQFKLISVLDNAKEITKQFNELTREFTTTILLVFLLLLIFLGLRQALISSITVPLTFLSSFAIIHALGLSLNFLTTFSFLIALGVLIDDAIVVVAAMTRYYATGRFTTAETGMLVWRDFIVPLISTAITTVWAFVPLLLASGIIGEFIKTIPIVVTVTMAASTVIALLVTLPLMMIFLKPTFPYRIQILLRILGIILVAALILTLIPTSPLKPLVILVAAILSFVTFQTRSTLYKTGRVFVSKNRYLRSVPAFTRRISERGLLDIEVVSKTYMRVIDRILVSKHGKRNTMIAIIAFTLIAYLLVPFGLVKNEFFPKTDADLLYVSGELPPGSTLKTNEREMQTVLQKIRTAPEITYIVGETGAGFNSGMGGRTSSSGSFLLTVHLTDVKERTPTSGDIAEELRERLKTYQGAKITVQELSGGPPAGADVQIKILGDDLTVLDTYASQVVAYLEKQPGVNNVSKSVKPGTSKLVFVPDENKLAESNVTVDQVGLWLRTYASGFKLDSVKFGSEKDKQDIVFRLSPNTETADRLGRVYISSVPLLSLGDLKLEANPTTITREEGKRTISVTAGVNAGQNVQDVNKKLEEFATTKLNLQEGYSWQTGGVNEENQKSVQSIMQAMVLSFLLILVTMVIEFRSFRQTFIALMFIPISISGVFYIFALTGTPLSFPALIGVLALFGIVVRHAIVVIEKINDDIKEGMTVRHAVVDAAGNRLEPVLLTSLAAIFGLIPITISDPLWRGLGGAIIAGLLFSGLIKLFFVPVVYYMWYPDKKLKK